jgi:hypothetical protein
MGKGVTPKCQYYSEFSYGLTIVGFLKSNLGRDVAE